MRNVNVSENYIHLFAYMYCVRDVKVIVVGNEHGDASSNPERSFFRKIPGERCKSNYSTSSYGLIRKQTGIFNLGTVTSLEDRKRQIHTSCCPGERWAEFKLFKICIKIDLVSHPTIVEGLGKYIDVLRSYKYQLAVSQ